jgi:hypothetical protein
MTQALYAHMNNKKINKIFLKTVTHHFTEWRKKIIKHYKALGKIQHPLTRKTLNKLCI